MKLRKQMWLLMAVGVMDFVLGLAIMAGIVCGERKEKEMQVDVGGYMTEPQYVALTFDDGPDSNYTEQLLDGLKERDVKATFFLTGACILGNEDLVKRMNEEGHLIGVHCMQHTDLTKMPMEKVLDQLEKSAQMIEDVTGSRPDYLRPPYGNWNETLGQAVWEELRMVPVFWDVDSLDWELQNMGKIAKKVLSDVDNGDIILMHDEFPASVAAALQIIDNLMAKGYTFVTVNELVVD